MEVGKRQLAGASPAGSEDSIKLYRYQYVYYRASSMLLCEWMRRKTTPIEALCTSVLFKTLKKIRNNGQ